MEDAAIYKVTERSNVRHLTDREELLGALFLLPAVVYIVALVGIPFFLAIAFSLSDVTVGDTSLDFVGLQNYSRVIKTPQFQRSLANTFAFTLVAQVIIIVLANILAVVLAQDFRGKWIARMLIMLPWATPIALGTIGWFWFLDSKFSPLDWVLQTVGLLGPGTLLGPGRHLVYLGREWLAMASVITVQVWRLLPLAAVILMAAFTSIDRDLIDQAEVDGATFWRIHFQIKLPLILPIMSIALLFSLIFMVGDIVVVYVLTRGGPVYYTQVLATWAYFKGIEGGSLSEGAAIALFLFPLLLAVAVLILRSARRMEVN
jgi:multiple sugar transport system permease protein